MGKISVHPVAIGRNDFGDVETFSAFYPLGCIVAYAKSHHDGALQESFDFARVTPRRPREIEELLDTLSDPPGIFLLSSYIWNHASNIQFAKQVKSRWPSALVVIGGPNIPRMPGPCRDFFAENPWLDIAVRHEGETALAEILDRIAESSVEPSDLARVDLAGVAGLTFRKDGDLVRTADRTRTLELGIFPSPYTTGEFDHWIQDKKYVPLETNRGCPYGCTFCDWGAATLSKLARMSLERVFGEVEFAAKKGIHTIGFTDANFGILERDLDIVRRIVELKNQYGFPRDVGYTNAKTAKPRLTEIIKLLRDNGLTAAAQISMQTTDAGVLENVKRANIKTSEYRKMIAFFHKENIPTVSDMMLGLPGQTFETAKTDLQFFFDHKVQPVIFATSVMPNAPMADPAYREKFGIELDEDNMVVATYSFTRDDYHRMFELCLAYKLLVKLGLLKYFLYFVQIEHGVKALDFIVRWLERVEIDPEKYPLSSRVKSDLLGRDYKGGRKDWLILLWEDEQARFLFDNMAAFQAEILAFTRSEFEIPLEGSSLRAILQANRAVLPLKGRELPAEVRLPHDVPGYFADLKKLPSIETIPPEHVDLGSRGPGLLRLDPQPPTISYQFADFVLTYGALQLASNLAI